MGTIQTDTVPPTGTIARDEHGNPVIAFLDTATNIIKTVGLDNPLPVDANLVLDPATITIGATVLKDADTAATVKVALPAGISKDHVALAVKDATTEAHGVSTWVVTDDGDNATVTATKAGEIGKSHYITGIHGSFSAAKIKGMALQYGITPIAAYHVHNFRDIVFTKPIKVTTGEDAILALEASGSAGTYGSVTMEGYTITEPVS